MNIYSDKADHGGEGRNAAVPYAVICIFYWPDRSLISPVGVLLRPLHATCGRFSLAVCLHVLARSQREVQEALVLS